MSISDVRSSIRRFTSRPESPYSLPESASSSRPVCFGSRAASCSAAPMRNRTSTGCFTTSLPATVAVPDVGSSSVVSMRTAVDLPAPFGPRKPYISPVEIARSISSTAHTSPKSRLNLLAVTANSDTPASPP